MKARLRRRDASAHTFEAGARFYRPITGANGWVVEFAHASEELAGVDDGWIPDRGKACRRASSRIVERSEYLPAAGIDQAQEGTFINIGFVCKRRRDRLE